MQNNSYMNIFISAKTSTGVHYIPAHFLSCLRIRTKTIGMQYAHATSHAHWSANVIAVYPNFGTNTKLTTILAIISSIPEKIAAPAYPMP